MIGFHIQLSGFRLSGRREIRKWLTDVIVDHRKRPGQIDFIFCSDEYILDLNRKHLSHDYYTDILTFDYSEDESLISGDIYISIDRVRENANELEILMQEELNRVMVHGILHLLGYGDRTREEKTIMRDKEDLYLMKIAH